MFGFSRVELTDHEFAKYLADNGAIHNFSHVSNSTTWRNREGVAVAVAIFDNSECAREIWVKDSE